MIQSYFKDWLMTSGNMRQVYDLARMERDEASGDGHGPNGSSTSSMNMH